MTALALEGLALVVEGELTEGMPRLDEATTAAVSGKMTNPLAIGLACCYLVTACDRIRDFARAAQWCHRVKEFCERTRFTPLDAVCRAEYATVLTWRGAWAEPEEKLESSGFRVPAALPSARTRSTSDPSRSPDLSVPRTGRRMASARTVLDALLVEAAVEAGAELQAGFAVDEILNENGKVTGIRGHLKGGASATRRARVVIGADGLHSLVAKAVQAQPYNERPTISVGDYAYWSGLPTDRFEAHLRPRRAFAIAPTNDGFTMGVVNWPRSEFEANRGDVEGHCLRAFELAPTLDARVRGAKLVSRFVGTGDLPNFFRTPYGPGWALVGPHHRPGHQRRLPRRRGHGRRSRRRVCGKALVRRRVRSAFGLERT